MNVLRFMQQSAAWMNRFADNLREIEAVEGEKPITMLNTHVIAVFDNGTSQTVWDVVGVETLPGGESMVIRIATPPPPAPSETNSDDAQEAQDEEEAIQKA